MIKPSEITPACSVIISKLCEKYLDSDGVIVCEGEIDVAIKVNNLPVDLFVFTGSTQVGKIIAGTAAKNLVPCILELGGKCPSIVDLGVEMHHAVSKIT